MNINQATISGNLTRDAELRYTQGGTAALSFTIAVNTRHRDVHGNWVDSPSFFDCVLFGKLAESLQPYMSKGQKLTASGRLRQSRWQDKATGQHRSRVEIVVDTIDLAGSARQTQAQPQPQAQPQAQAYTQPQSAPIASAPQQVELELYDEEIPF